MFWGKSVIDGDYHDPELVHEPPTQPVVLSRAADDVSAAVNPQQRGCASRRRRRTMNSELDVIVESYYFDAVVASAPGEALDPTDQWKGAP
ncbi:hypothetical protein GCM10023318_30140 [Nocardia callitridis]|uniref:Uncharacterized protein n=1 Tax=Nocardia callitridis TaxID=648753 RepID=A0ABP9KD38_9NOCA